MDTPVRTGPRSAGNQAVMPPWVPRAVLTLMLGIAGLFAVYRLFLWLRPLLLMLLIAFFLSLALEPAVDWLARRGWRRGLATLFVAVVVLTGALGFAFTMGQLLVEQTQAVVQAAPAYAENLTAWLDEQFDIRIPAIEMGTIFDPGQSTARNLLGELAGSALEIAGSALGLVFNLFSIALFAFYLTADGPRFRRTVCRVVPMRYQPHVLQAWTIAIGSTGGYIYSRGVLAVVAAVVHGIAFMVIGVPNAFALAVWVGAVSQFVPTVGTYIAGVIPIVVALASNPADALWVLGVILVYQQFENYVVAPPLTARTMSLHPAVAFGSVVAGAAVLGPVGALLALPAAASIQAFVTTWVRMHDVIEDPLTRLDGDEEPADEGGDQRPGTAPVTAPDA